MGKSTLAERYAAAHPGVLNCDIDRLRCLIGGWEDDFDGAGDVVRPLALAMIGAHLAGGRDVVLPQMLARDSERARFAAVAIDNGHEFVHVLLQAGPGQARARFHGRAPDDALFVAIRRSVEQQGGDRVIDVLDRHLASSGSDAVLDASRDLDATCSALRELLQRAE
ncbi:ATP-binding protein [Nocardioides sp. JQ2195]|nr:ATP-binding protein [Nocardioides sp. JQ2195]